MRLQKTGSTHTEVYNKRNTVTTVLFVIYLLALCWILLFKLGVRFSYMHNRSVNLIPFRELLRLHGNADYSQLIMNAVIFVPLGIYAGTLFRQWAFGKKLFLFFCISLLCEAFQFIMRIGAFDVTDIITNTFGGIIGLMTFKAIEKVFNNNIKAQKFINGLAAIGTVLMIFLLLLLKLNMLPIRYQ